jgi:hypothetical protein
MHRLAARILTQRTSVAQPARVIYVMRATLRRVINSYVSTPFCANNLELAQKFLFATIKTQLTDKEEFVSASWTRNAVGGDHSFRALRITE